jgi:hypothetical protein
LKQEKCSGEKQRGKGKRKRKEEKKRAQSQIAFFLLATKN